jgi:hypothetical protein
MRFTGIAGIGFRGLAAFVLLLNTVPSLAAPAKKLTAQEKADVRYVRKQYEQKGEHDLDLRDKANYRFVVSQFERAGLTRTRYPQFYRSIDGLAKTGPVAAPAALVTDTTEPINAVIEVKTNDQQSFAAQALSSIPGGTISTLLTLGVYDENDDPIGPPSEIKDFASGRDVLINANGAFATPTPEEGRLVQAVGMYFYEDSVGGHHAGPMMAAFAFYPKKIQDDAPIAIKNPNQIVVCLNRTGVTSDCDYDCSAGVNCTQQPPDPWKVQFPVKGYIEYFKNIDVGQDGKPSNATARIVTTFTQSGGACKLPLENFFANPNTKVENGNRLVWNIDPAVFGTACYPGRSDVTYAFFVNLYTQGVPIAAYINNTGGTPEQNTFKIPPMKIFQGCLAPGSKITLEGGGEMVIEAFDGGERVRTEGNRGLTVAGTIYGRESKPLVKITTKDGQTLSMTDEHPVPTTRGIRLARELTAGDVVFTRNGRSAITTVVLEPYTGIVHNMEVTALKDDPKLTPENRTFYANGILVGDAVMQGYWSDVVASREGRRAVPKRWLVDYRSAERDAVPAKR